VNAQLLTNNGEVGLAIAVLLLQTIFPAKGEETNANKAGRPAVTRRAEGEATNWLRGSLAISWPAAEPNLAEVVVEAIPSPDPDQQPDLSKNWVAQLLDQMNHDDWWYFKATNAFCGPLEMRDASGQRVKLLLPELTQADAYPLLYTLDGSQQRYMKRYRFPVAPSRNLDALPWRQPELARFKLLDYFEITNAGDYTLTVWPKVYVRISTNNFECKRLDVPPVTVSFHYEPASP